MHIHDVSCIGTESELLDCPHVEYTSGNFYGNAASMRCYYGVFVQLDNVANEGSANLH